MATVPVIHDTGRYLKESNMPSILGNSRFLYLVHAICYLYVIPHLFPGFPSFPQLSPFDYDTHPYTQMLNK